jgi:hypothetical protein
MTTGNVDEIDLVAPEAADVKQKIKMKTNDQQRNQNGRDPAGLTQKFWRSDRHGA